MCFLFFFYYSVTDVENGKADESVEQVEYSDDFDESSGSEIEEGTLRWWSLVSTSIVNNNI